jgi:Flp pilus assembly protein TadD
MALTEVLQADPGNAAAALWLTDVLARHDRASEAIRWLERASRDRPGAIEARTRLAGLLEHVGRIAEARAEYEQVVAMGHGAHAAAIRLAHIHLADDGDVDRALELALSVVRDWPEDAEANGVIGRIYLRRALPRQAVAYLERAVRASPADAPLRYHLGTAYVRAGRSPEGRREHARALELDPSLPDAIEEPAQVGQPPR